MRDPFAKLGDPVNHLISGCPCWLLKPEQNVHCVYNNYFKIFMFFNHEEYHWYLLRKRLKTLKRKGILRLKRIESKINIVLALFLFLLRYSGCSLCRGNVKYFILTAIYSHGSMGTDNIGCKKWATFFFFLRTKSIYSRIICRGQKKRDRKIWMKKEYLKRVKTKKV